MPSAPVVIGAIGLITYGFYKLFGGKGTPKPTPDPDPPEPDPKDDDYAAVCFDGAAAKQGWVTSSIQAALAKLGYPPGLIDGICGPNTKKAILAFQADYALGAVGYVNEATGLALTNALEDLKIKADGAYDPVAYAEGCNQGSTDANATINSGGTDKSRDVSGMKKDYAIGYRECFMKTLASRGWSVDEDGNFYPPDDEGAYTDGDVIIMGDSL
jgi:peptidoglycan hydrolase-like protein with peptidoglycan-binding domain